MAVSLNTVVIAEDNLEICNVIKEYFERVYELDVYRTDKVDGILPLVLRTNASVLIMDLELKDGDASRIIKDVAAIPGLIVIVFTGTWKIHEETDLLEHGAQVVMRKPQKPATIWQQVVNLRKLLDPEEQKYYKVSASEGTFSYDTSDGLFGSTEGNPIVLVDIKKKIMDFMTQGLAEYQTLSAKEKKEKAQTAGWLNRKDIIAYAYSTTKAAASDTDQAFRYHVRSLATLLKEHVDGVIARDLIENKREGRYQTYYRLNPEVLTAEEIIPREQEKKDA